MCEIGVQSKELKEGWRDVCEAVRCHGWPRDMYH